MNQTTQLRSIYCYLMDGRLLDREQAMTLFGTQNLTARMSVLRKLGVQFNTYYFPQKHSTRIASYGMSAEQRRNNGKYLLMCQIHE